MNERNQYSYHRKRNSRVVIQNNRSKINLVIKYSSFLILGLVIILTGISCNNNPTKDDVNTSSNLTEEVNEVSGNLKEDYNAWFQLQGKYIENFNLQIAEVKVGENSWNTQNLVVAMIENLTDKERGGFFIGKDIYFPVAALDEKILILEEIATQIKSEVRKYNCTRRYTTSYGITIIFQYSSQEHKWNNIQIYYSPDSYSVEVKPDCLLNYIQGLKECKKYIIDYTAKKWDNK
jgi:hypothetical protein